MASLTLEEKVPKLRPPDSKNTRSPRARASSLKHKARFPTEAVKQSEESLRQLLDDFDHGRLSAFGSSDMLQKMKDIREMQERLTMKHFEIDQLKMVPDTASNTGPSDDREDGQLLELTQALEKLGSTIQSLNSNDPLGRKANGTGSSSSKKVKLQENVTTEEHTPQPV